MRECFTPLRVATVLGLGLLLVLWCCSMIGLMGNTRLGKLYRYRISYWVESEFHR
jgi:hypothetical protein